MCNRYIHYGDSEFDIFKFESIRNPLSHVLPKPYGGLWASPIKAKNLDWYSWCIDNQFDTDNLHKSFIFELAKNANIFTVSTNKDLEKLKDLIGTKTPAGCYYDFEALELMGFDGLEVEINTWDIYMGLYGWDVDSILIFNPDVIIL